MHHLVRMSTKKHTQYKTFHQRNGTEAGKYYLNLLTINEHTLRYYGLMPAPIVYDTLQHARRTSRTYFEI